MKKFVFMFLALAMCLSLAAPAFAAEEETEATNEAAAQAEAHSHVYYESNFTGVLPDDYTTTTHVYVTEGCLHTCNCGDHFLTVKKSFDQAHTMKKTGSGVIIDDGSGPVTVYQYACRQCNYTHIDT